MLTSGYQVTTAFEPIQFIPRFHLRAHVNHTAFIFRDEEK